MDEAPGIRKGNIEWTKLQEGKDAEKVTTKVNGATKNYDKWFIRQMFRAVGTICALTEFASEDGESLKNTVMLLQIMMADHEEEILLHLKTLGRTNADIAKAYTLFPENQTIHELDGDGHIVQPTHVPDMYANAVGELTTIATAEGERAVLLRNSRMRPPGSRSRCDASLRTSARSCTWT